MPRETQNKILRVLVDQTFQRVGGTNKVKVDVRIVSSTGRNIEAEIAAGNFREDLYHRLSVVPIRVPPLAERREDIPELVDYFMEQISQATGLPQARRSARTRMAVLQSHDWPGNVRQLRNNVERLMILAGGEPDAVITADMLPQDVGSMVPSMPNGNGGEQLMGLPLREAREVFEREYLVAQINRFGGNISRTAEFVGMERSALHRKLKSLGDRLTSRSLQMSDARSHESINRMPASPMSTAATAARDAMVHVEDRGYQFADGVYEVCEVRAGRLIDERRHWSGCSARSANCASRCRCRARRSASCCARRSRATASRRHRLSAGDARRRPPRPCLPAAGDRAEPGGHRAQRSTRRQRASAPRPASPSSPCRTIAGARVDIKTVGAAAQCAGQAGGARAGRPGGLVRRHATATSPKAPRPMPGS